jgi:tetratricopeptide (TPR) repeat protein
VLGSLARLYHAAGRDDLAREPATRAAELDPHGTDAWLALAAISPDDEAAEYLERAMRNQPDAAAPRRAMCLVGARIDHPRAYDDCLRAGIEYRDDGDIVLAKAAVFEARGDLVRARAELSSGTYSIKDDVRLFVKQAELEAKLGYDYDLPKTRARACELGHAPSCDAAADKPDAR